MRRSSSCDSRKSMAPGRVARPSSAKKPQPIKRFPSTDCLSSGRFSTGQNGRFSTGQSGRPSLLGRPSIGKSSTGGAMSKRMSRGIDRGRCEIKETRPISSRAYQQRCVKILYEFLMARGYPNHITPKILLSPTTKDFLRVFEFIVRTIEYKYKVPDKYEEEIPKYLRMIGYPFMISRSSMIAVGSPHTWPHVLAALVWLVHLVNTGLAMNEELDSFIFPVDFDSASHTKVVFKYMVEAYKSYMGGSDSFESIDKEFYESLSKDLCGDKDSMDNLEQENANLSEKLREYEEHSNNLQELQETKLMQEKDLVKLTNYAAELEMFESKLEIGDTDVKMLEEELESQLAQLKSCQAIIDNQEYSPADVERFRMEEERLQRESDDLEKEIAQLDEELWNDEIAIGKQQEKLNESCCEHNKLCRMLELIPINAINSNGLDFELKPNFLHGSTEDQFKKHKSQLLEVKGKISDEFHFVNGEKRKLENILVQQDEQLEEMSTKIKDLTNNLKRLEETLKNEKNLYEQSIKSKQALYDQEYKELNESHMLAKQLEHEIDLLRIDVNKVKECSTKEDERNEKVVEEYVEFLQKVGKRVAEHKARIISCLKSASEESTEKKRLLAKKLEGTLEAL